MSPPPGEGQPVRYQVGDIVKMKKPHPCGGDEWEILRTGVDFRLRCRRCDRVILIPRPKFLKGVKQVVTASDPAVNP